MVEERVRELAARYPASRDVLDYYRQVAAFSGRFEDLAGLAKRAPLPLRQAARGLDEAGLREAMDSYLPGHDLRSPRSLLARLMLRHALPAPPKSPSPEQCARCGQPPQCAVVDGEEGFALVCSLCRYEWSFPPGRCTHCGSEDPEGVYSYRAEEMPQVETRVCESCQRYMHVIRRDVEPAAVPEVDELIALPLDAMCADYGFVKIHPNLAGV